MSEYSSPNFNQIDDVAEGVYVSSGAIIQNPSEDKTDMFGDWSWQVTWRNHNSGSHSEMEVEGHNYSGKSGSHIGITLSFFGRGKITGVAMPSKATGYDWGENYIKITYDGVFNPGENVVFGLPSVTFSDSPEHGSYHKSGEHCYTSAYDAFAITSIECK